MKVKNTVIGFLLGDFRKGPGMFLGKNHISLLSTFMAGYMISLQRNGYDISTDSFFGNETTGFFEWYKNKTGILFSSNWYLTILEQCGGSEEKGLEEFFILLEEYNNNILKNSTS